MTQLCRKLFTAKKLIGSINFFELPKFYRNAFTMIYIPYARHYNPRFVYFLPHVWFSLWFILQTIYVLKTEILHLLSLKSAVYNRELFQIQSGLWWRAYSTCTWPWFQYLQKINSNTQWGGWLAKLAPLVYYWPKKMPVRLVLKATPVFEGYR